LRCRRTRSTRSRVRGTLASAVFDEIRLESNRDAVILARKFADMCMRAADQLNDNHQRTVARCVSELFEQFAAKLDHREPANSN